MDGVILKGNLVRREQSSHARHAAAVAKGAHPEVRLIQLDGAVRALEVRCSCGDTITVELEVPTEPEGAATPPNPGAGGAA